MNAPMAAEPDAFRTTRWTRVLAARGQSPEARVALGDLCADYYAPVEAFVRRYRHGRDDARDLTQEFFAVLLEGRSLGGVEPTRGRFRSYLLGAVKHFLADRAARAAAAKRGGDRTSLGEMGLSEVADPDGFPPDAFFDRQWALAVVESAMVQLRTESTDGDDSGRFEVLKGWLIASADGADAAGAARTLGMTDGAFKVAVHRLRKRFRVLVRERIAASLGEADSLDGELDHLIRALGAAG